MKIKLAILESDQSYLERLLFVFSTRYADKFELYSFTEQEAALATAEAAKIDVLLASDTFQIPVSSLPERCGLAYLVDSSDVDLVQEQKAVCKFQKAELIYKQILSIYSEKAGRLFELRQGDSSGRILLFDSICGGAGASSMAAACAIHLAMQQKKVLYLNLEPFGAADVFFRGEGQFDMSDVIYALKSRKANLSLKLESCVRQDARGVFYFAKSKNALDLLELKEEELLQLLEELKAGGVYDCMILDTSWSLSLEFMKVYRKAQAIIWVSDGSEVANGKIARAYEALSIREQKADAPLQNRVSLIYNKFSNKTGEVINGLKSMGGAPRYEHAATEQILSRLSQLELFDNLK